VNATTLDDVRAATGTSKSQLYAHFPDKEALIREVIALRGQQVLERERQRLERLSSFSGLVRWRNALVQVNSLQNGAYGCALGSMASELADQDEQARATGTDLLEGGQPNGQGPLRRLPLFLESSLPGVFAAGDVRHGSVKRVASAVGEGSTVIRLVHDYLRASDVAPLKETASIQPEARHSHRNPA
jgi:AcrR family transcriptional regulator